ncbi:MAG: hypothetical protein AB1797_01995 [bacterium]
MRKEILRISLFCLIRRQIKADFQDSYPANLRKSASPSSIVLFHLTRIHTTYPSPINQLSFQVINHH